MRKEASHEPALALVGLGTLLLGALAAPAAAAQEQYGVVLRTTDGAGAHTDRIRIQSQVGLSRALIVNSYLDLSGQKIVNVATPTSANDAANKAYVDAAVSTALFNGFAQVADSAGSVQFSAAGSDAMRFAAGSGLALSFNAATKQVSFAIAAGGVTDAHLAGGIDPAKIAGTALTAATTFSAAAAGDATVTGTAGALNIQLKPGSVTPSDISGTIPASQVEDVWVNASGDTMSGQLVANAGLAVPTGQELRLLSAANANWSLRTTSGSGELYADFTGESASGETRAWRLRDLAGAGATRFSVDMLTGAVSLTGAMAMGTNKITNLADPTAAQDAATKAYVDSVVTGSLGITTMNGENGPAMTLAGSAGIGVSVTAADTLTFTNLGATSVHGVTGGVNLTAGSGITLSPTATNPISIAVNFAGTGSAATAARSDHAHATLAAGTGLTGSAYDGTGGATFAVSFGGTGVAASAARSDHDHDPAYVNVSGDTITGSLGVGQTPAADEKMVVVGAEGSIIIRSGMILLALVQALDHAGRDFTLDGRHGLRGSHRDVRILTVTLDGEVEPDGEAAEITAKAAVVDGVLSGGPWPLIVAAGGMDAGRYPVLLTPIDGEVVGDRVELTWYPASRSAGLSYEVAVEGPDRALVRLGPLEGLRTDWVPTFAGEHVWKVAARTGKREDWSEAWTVWVDRAAPTAAGGGGDRPFFGGGNGNVTCSAGAGGARCGVVLLALGAALLSIRPR